MAGCGYDTGTCTDTGTGTVALLLLLFSYSVLFCSMCVFSDLAAWMRCDSVSVCRMEWVA